MTLFEKSRPKSLDKFLVEISPKQYEKVYARAAYCAVLGVNVADRGCSILRRSKREFKKFYGLTDADIKERYLQNGYAPLKFAVTPKERKEIYIDFFMRNEFNAEQGETIYAALGDIIGDGHHTNLIKMQEAMDALKANFSNAAIIELLTAKVGRVKIGYVLLANVTRRTPQKIAIAKAIEKEHNRKGFAKLLLLAVGRATISTDAYYRYRYLKDNLRGKISIYAITHAAIFKRTIARHTDNATAIKVSSNGYLQKLYERELPAELRRNC